MNRYNEGKIYKIVDVAYTKCYVGSTRETLSQRMARHREKYNSYIKGKGKFTTSFNLFDEFGVDNCKIELIENYPCQNKDELRRKEGHFIKNTDCVNKLIAGRTDKEYRQDNREKILEQKREDYEQNKQRWKDYYEANKEQIIARQQTLVECPVCGAQVQKGYVKIHKHKPISRDRQIN